jgi:hypothetical protein
MAIFWYIFFIGSYAVYSYAHTDPNIVYSYHPLFVSFQKQMWFLGMDERLLSTVVYVSIIAGLFYAYKSLLIGISKKTITTKQLSKVVGIAIALLLIANPALSHDLYNYLFNARMVVEYQTNPHTHNALEFANDPWTRYMHNTHTVAPYGYGWTALSLIPYALGFESLKLTMITFKGSMVIFFALLIIFQKKLQSVYKNNTHEFSLWAFIINPLVLIETFGNGHNDVVMMGLAMCAVWFFQVYLRDKKMSALLFSTLALALSVSIKYASIVLVGGSVINWVAKKIKMRVGFGEANALLLALPLLTVRSQQFLPWYLIWPLSFLPFIKNKLLFNTLLIFSFSSMMRYIPTIFLPTFNRPIADSTLRLIEISITFTLPVLYVLYSMLKQGRGKASLSLVE